MTSNPKHILASKSNEHWTPAMAKKLTVDGAYIAAMNDCKGKCGCIKNKANNYVNITQNMWTKNQNDMIETRRQSKPTSDELDDEMKGRINHELRKVASTLLSTSVRVSLTFPVTMRIYSEPKDAHDMEPSKVLGTKEFFLCESCYVYYEYHKCKLFFNIYFSSYLIFFNEPGFRTFRGWKSQIKDSIVLLDNMQDTVASVRKKVAYISAKYPSLTDKTFTHVNQARKAFAKYDLSPIEIQAICVPDGAGSLEAYGWLLEFFSLVGDSSPNRYEKVQIPGKL